MIISASMIGVATSRMAITYTRTKALPPLAPRLAGNCQILPRPTAAPIDARIKARRPDQLSVVWVLTGRYSFLF